MEFDSKKLLKCIVYSTLISIIAIKYAPDFNYMFFGTCVGGFIVGTLIREDYL